MTIVEKAAYLKGLTAGLGIEPDSRDGKLWAALTDLLADMAHEIEDLQSGNLDLADALDEIGESLGALETRSYDLDRPEDFFAPDEDDWQDEEDDGEEDGEADFDGVLYDVVCPVCGTEITLDEEMLAEGSIVCPGCGETLEFDWQDGE